MLFNVHTVPCSFCTMFMLFNVNAVQCAMFMLCHVHAVPCSYYSIFMLCHVHAVSCSCCAMFMQCHVHTMPFLVGNIYRTPDIVAVFFDHLRNTLDQVSNTNMEMYLIGHFNCNMLNKSNLSQRMCEMADEYQLTQHINEHTRITNNSTTCIDLVYSSHPEKISQSGVVTIRFSDNDMPFVVRKSTMPKERSQTGMDTKLQEL